MTRASTKRPELPLLIARLRLAVLLSPWLALCLLAAGASVHAQSLTVDGPPGPVLPTITPRFTLTARGLPLTARPLLFTLLISRSATADGSFVETIDASSSDSVVNLIVRRVLPNAITVYWKARLTLPDGTSIESNVSSARQVPPWLTLITPNSPQGNPEPRRPRFVWQSARIDPAFGSWTYDLQILNNERTEQSVSGLRDTVFVPSDELQANSPYRWQVRASVVPTGDAVTVRNVASFTISDPRLPTTTLLYQNFPNPFPSVASFTTCFWFDVKVGGARVSLDIIDLRGSLVKRIIPQADFAAGIYGRGPEGSGNNCDNRFVWNGTASDGRSVAGGIYLARFIAAGSPPLFKKIVFKGR